MESAGNEGIPKPELSTVEPQPVHLILRSDPMVIGCLSWGLGFWSYALASQDLLIMGAHVHSHTANAQPFAMFV